MVQVIAVDGKDDTKKATATVTITIKDINDNSPEFPKDTYMLNVTEHSPDGTVIATITVSPLHSGLLPRQFELACKKLFNLHSEEHTLFAFPLRQMILTQWMKATSPTDFFQRACMSTFKAVILVVFM